jgi:hypothetical protein
MDDRRAGSREAWAIAVLSVEHGLTACENLYRNPGGRGKRDLGFIMS